MTMTLAMARCEVRRKEEELKELSLAARVCGHCCSSRLKYDSKHRKFPNLANRSHIVNLYFYQVLKLFSMQLVNKII